MKAGGILVMLGLLVGAGIGIALRESSLGAVLGLGAGLLLAGAYALVTRRN